MIENSNSESQKQTYRDYLSQAALAGEKSEAELAIYLYLAAFRAASIDSPFPNEDCIAGLKTAWALAVNLKNRTLAELIFEQLEHFLSHSEIEMYAAQLQDLALDKLEEFGITRNDIHDLMDALPEGLLGMDDLDLSSMKIAQMSAPFLGAGVNGRIDLTSIQLPKPEDIVKDFDDLEPKDSAPADHECSTCKPHLDNVRERPSSLKVPDRSKIPAPGTPLPINQRKIASPSSVPPNMPFVLPNGRPARGEGVASVQRVPEPDTLCYKDLAGFESAVEKMRTFGIGSKYDAEFDEFIAMLNKKHGVDATPSLDTLVFRAPVREDANRLMEATFGELKLPGVRMHVEENPMGEPVLCVMAQTGAGLRMNNAHNGFESAAVLLLEDIDLWGHMLPNEEDMENQCAHLTHAAFEAIRLIESAVDNPDVYVLASCQDDGKVDPAFLDMISPVSVIQLQNPTASERRSIWGDVILKHSSVSGVDIPALVDYSSNMSRYDIYMAAREAIDASYKASLASHEYFPVTTAQICECLAAYQPLDSKEYQRLEDMVIDDFRNEIADLDSLLSGEMTDFFLDQIADGSQEDSEGSADNE